MRIINESITCDNCNKELIVDSQYPHEYALELSVIDTNRSTSNAQYCVHQEPPLKRTLNFCDKSCLKEWSQK